VAGSARSELETIRDRFLIRKLGLADGPDLITGIDNKRPAVVYCLLNKPCGREAAYA
jgi:hypothetical protein